MLHLVIGRSGYGKTEYMWGSVSKDIAQDRKIIILVPEQFSFVNEKRICEIQRKMPYANIEVLSFTRLATMIFREYGGISGAPLTDSASNMIMAITMSEIKDDLRVYRRQLDHNYFAESMVQTMKMLKQHNLMGDSLKNLSDQIGEGFLKSKLRELSIIYNNYQSKIDSKYFDTSDSLGRACKRLEKSPNFFKEYVVYTDGFKDFTESEYDMLRYIISDSQDVYVNLCMNNQCMLMQDQVSETSIFRRVRSTADRLLHIASEGNVGVAETVMLDTPHRFQNEQLRMLENSLVLGIDNNQLQNISDDSAVKIIETENQYVEVEYISSQIWNLVRDRKYRFKDIIVIVRDLQLYKSIIENVFEIYEIPYFIDERKSIEYKSLIVFVLSSLGAVRSNFNTIQILKILKTGLIDEDYTLISQLELYCNIWNIKSDMWCNQFIFNPKGFSDKFSDEDKLLLERLNTLREKIIVPLESLKLKTRGKISSKQFVKALYEYLIELNIPEALNNTSLSAYELGEETQDENSRLWDMLIDILDEIDTIADGKSMAISGYIDLLQVAITSTDLGLVPQMLDQVMIGRADRIVTSNPKAVFIMGMNQGVFPLPPQSDGIFSEQEQKQLTKLGAKISHDKLEKSIEERYYAYLALTCARECVYISYFRNSKDGKLMYKSSIVSQIERMFPSLEILKVKDNSLSIVQNTKTAYSYLCRNYKTESIECNSVKKYITEVDTCKYKIELPTGLDSKNMFSIENSEIIKDTIGNKLRLYPSSIERFHLCRFKFFCNDMLKIRDCRKAEINRMESGTVIHYVLRKILEMHVKTGNLILNEEYLKFEIKSFLDEYINSVMGGYRNKDNRFKYLYKNLQRSLESIVNHLFLELKFSEFKPYKFEMDIDSDKEAQPLILKTQSGEEIIISGKIDRVDILEKDGQKYVRIIDYKSGDKKFNLDDIRYGLNMQMLLYLLALCECGKENLRGVKPAGILYMSVRKKIITAKRSATGEKIEKDHMDNMKMTGLMSDDIEILNAMERGIEGNFIPAKLKKDGSLSATSSVIKVNEMDNLMMNIKDIILDMAKAIYNGDIEAVPTEHSKYDVCDYCEYKPICKRQDKTIFIQ